MMAAMEIAFVGDVMLGRLVADELRRRPASFPWGDTLPLLCDRIYSDPSYYPDVARFNNLSDFRRLQPGQRLHFPPLG